MNLFHDLLIAAKIYAEASAGLIVASLLFRAWHHIRGTANSMPMTPENIKIAMEKSNHESRVHRWLVAFDIFLNVTFMNGQNDETMSAHCWRASLEGHKWGIAMNWWLEGFQPHHGYQAACGDLQRSLNRAECEKKALGLS